MTISMIRLNKIRRNDQPTYTLHAPSGGTTTREAQLRWHLPKQNIPSPTPPPKKKIAA